ncbi:MAG TPA: hypothetical protein VH475_09790 [Tepidisphaeraceae bacterium]
MEGSSKTIRPWQWAGVVLVGLAVLQMSCGTIIYPERRGQKAGDLDVGVVLLDGACLLVFVIPGIVAYAVDFSTGAIYLPPNRSRERSSDKKYDEVRIPPSELTPQRIEQVVYEHTGKSVDLHGRDFRTVRIENLDRFTPQDAAKLEASATASPGFDELMSYHHGDTESTENRK